MRLQGKVAIVTGGASGFGAGSMTCQGNGLRAQRTHMRISWVGLVARKLSGWGLWFYRRPNGRAGR